MAVMGQIVCLQIPMLKFLARSTSEWDLIWKEGLCRYNQIKMGWIKVGRKSNDLCPFKNEVLESLQSPSSSLEASSNDTGLL